MKKSKKLLVLLMIAIMVTAVCAGCAVPAQQEASQAHVPAKTSETAQTETSETAETKDAKDIKIGFLAMNRTMTWMQYALKGAQSKADELGVELVIYDAENEVSNQTSMMEDLVALGVDAIITDPINVESLKSAVTAAYEEGVPTFTFDRRCEGAPYIGFVGCDDTEGGRMAAKYIAEKLGGKGKVVELVGAEGSSPAIDRGNGFHEEMENYPDIEIVYSQSGEFTAEKGMSVMEDAITAVGEFDAVFSHNDDMFLGAIQAIKDAGINLDDIVTISYDGTPDALTLVKNGEHDATIQYPSAQAGVAIQKAVDYVLTGKEPEIKDELMEPWVITADNLDTGDFYAEVK